MSDPDFEVEFLGMRISDPELAQQIVDRMQVIVGNHRAHSEALGALCLAYSALDWTITGLYPPLLQCTEAQAACIAEENISRRCAVAIKLLHLEELPHDLVDWITGLLRRADGELGALRNRYVHDAYIIRPDYTLRVERRPKLGKPQSHKRSTVIYNTEHPTTVEEIERVAERVSTVSSALTAGARYLEIWRQSGQPPPLDPQWLPASKPNSRCMNYQANSAAPEIPLDPLEFEFD